MDTVPNFIGGRWVPSRSPERLDVFNPALGAVIAKAPLSTREEVDLAVRAATEAFPAWRDTPPAARARVMFTFRAKLEARLEELAGIITTENGKTLDEARGSVRRGIECVEVACGAPSLLMGAGLENVSAGNQGLVTVSLRETGRNGSKPVPIQGDRRVGSAFEQGTRCGG